MNLILIRHGECGTNSTDDILTSVGEWQAQKIGQRLADVPITALLSSPLLRALGTASIIAHTLGDRPVEVWTELREGLYSPHRGYGRQELLQHFPLAILPPNIEDNEFNYSGDTQETMFERCHLILSRLHERFRPDDTIVAVAHGGILTYLFHVLLHISPHTPCWFKIDYGAINQVRIIPKDVQMAYPPLYPQMEMEILSTNDIAHLVTHEEPSLQNNIL